MQALRALLLFSIVAAFGKTFNGYFNISKVSTCILKPDVTLRKRIENF